MKKRNSSVKTKKDAREPAVKESGEKAIRVFSVLDPNERLEQIIIRASGGNVADFPLVRHAILHDPEMMIKFAALKRIHHFAGHPELLPFMTALRENESAGHWEPYFSMALSRLGLISGAEFEQKMNGIE